MPCGRVQARKAQILPIGVAQFGIRIWAAPNVQALKICCSAVRELPRGGLLGGACIKCAPIIAAMATVDVQPMWGSGRPILRYSPLDVPVFAAPSAP